MKWRASYSVQYALDQYGSAVVELEIPDGEDEWAIASAMFPHASLWNMEVAE